MAKRGMVVIIVQPTIELIDKTITEELLTRPDPPPHHVFHSKSVLGGVSKAFAEYLKCPQDGGQIIFATHQVLQFIPYWTNKSDLHLFIDEDLQAVRHKEHRLPHTHDLITEHIKIVPYNAIFGKVVVADQAINAKARNKDEDAILDVIADPLRIITNVNWETFVNLEQYEKLRDGDGHTLAFHSVLRPTILAGFGSVFMAAAEFEDTAICRLWTEAGIQFIQDTEFTDKLRYNSHPNGELITFYYVTDDPWSKRLRNKTLDEGKVLDLMLTGAAKLFSNTDFVWQANAEYTDNPFGTQGIRLPNKPHGLNSYSHLHDIVFVSSLNPNPDHIKFLKSRGLSSQEIRACIYYATCYQSIMRISTRNPDDTDPKRILVPDLGAAQHLQGLFPGSKIEWLDIGIPKGSMGKEGGRPRKHSSNAARRSQQRKNAREKLLNHLRKLIGQKASQDRLIQGGMDDRENEGAENPISIISSIGTAVSDGSLFKDRYQSKAFSFVSCASNEDFIDALHNIWSENVLASKEANQLISPALFDPALSPHHDRGLENIVYCRHLYLDFENGDLKPEEFPKLFPKLRMVVANTFNHSGEKPRFRVVIPTTDIMTPEVYCILQNQITSKLEEAGYTVERKGSKKADARRNNLRSGLDTGKQAPNSLFYLPCQVKGAKNSFFRYYDDEGRDFLDATVWVENGLIPTAPDPVDWIQDDYHQSDWIDRDAVDAAIARWQSTPKGQGHDAFFQLAVDLRGAGMGAIDLQLILRTQADSARSKRERKADIQGIMRTLKERSRIPLKA